MRSVGLVSEKKFDCVLLSVLVSRVASWRCEWFWFAGCKGPVKKMTGNFGHQYFITAWKVAESTLPSQAVT